MKKKVRKKFENSEKKTVFKSCWGRFGGVFGISNDPKKIYQGGYDQKNKSQNENPQRWIDSQLNYASFKTDFKLK